jgi:pimeloyl-ACP methyl ester carboxylesterase
VLVNLERRGKGKPLVLIHGIGHRWQAWEPVLDELSRHHEVIAIDLPGFGRSPIPAGGMPADMPATVAHIVEYLAAQGIEQPHVAGNSLGGAIALELAAAGAMASATAFAPAGFYTESERRRALRMLNTMRANTFLLAPVMKAGLRVPSIKAISLSAIVADPSRIPSQRAYEDALAMRRGRGFRPVARLSVAYRFEGSPEVPVSVGWGAKDRIFGAHQLDRVRERIPHAHVEVLEGCGHVPMSDAPGLVTSLILRTTRCPAPAPGAGPPGHVG